MSDEDLTIGCNICGEALPDGEPHVCAPANDRETLVGLKLVSFSKRMEDGCLSTVIRDNEEAADLVLAAGFQRAVQGTPTARELQALRHAVENYDVNFPCDGGCDVNDGPEETCSRHGRSPRDLWNLLDAATTLIEGWTMPPVQGPWTEHELHEEIQKDNS